MSPGVRRHAQAIVALPFVVTLAVPGLILYFWQFDTFDLVTRAPLLRAGLSCLGALLVIAGMMLFVATNHLFITIGLGTLAPWDPTRKLIVRGVYRHVRNPMITGIMAILLGESLLTASLPLFLWFSLFLLTNLIYVPLVEESLLLKKFGDEYDEYRRNVPRWLPRLGGSGAEDRQ